MNPHPIFDQVVKALGIDPSKLSEMKPVTTPPKTKRQRHQIARKQNVILSNAGLSR